MISEGKLKIKMTSVSDGTRVVLMGVIDEDADLSAVLGAKGNLTINFSDVTMINSLGIRGWVNFIKECKSPKVTYEECPPVIVRQLNMIPSFMGKAEVLSAYATYVCEQCDAEALVLCEQPQIKALKVPNPIECTSCKKGKMEFDGQPEQYFAFAK